MNNCAAYVAGMSTPSKPFIRPEPISKNKLREMLAQAVRNTQPDLNRPTGPEPEPKLKRDRARARSRTPARQPTKGAKDRISR